jgi:hypothetical protein
MDTLFAVAVAFADIVMVLPDRLSCTPEAVAVAGADITIVLLVYDTTVAPVGIPLPAMACPTATPVVFTTLDMVALVLVVSPVVVNTTFAVFTTLAPAGIPEPDIR